MLKITIYTVGKKSDPWMEKGISIYIERLKKFLAIEWVYPKDDKTLTRYLIKEPQFICLDPKGKVLSSLQFSSFLLEEFEKNGSKIVFVIGGVNGLEKHIMQKASHLISLSALTFTHQLARVVLIEQLYRGVQIIKGSPYHK